MKWSTNRRVGTPRRASRPRAMTLEGTIGKCLNDAQISLTTHKRGAKTLCARRHENPESFLPTFCNAVLPVLLEYRVRARGDGDASGGSRKVASTRGWGEVTSEGMNGMRRERMSSSFARMK